MPVRIGLSIGLFVGSLALGWWLHRRGRLDAARATRLVWFVMTGPSPVVLCLLFWQMNLRSAELWLLPFLGLLISSSTLLPAILYARYARLSGPQKGSFLNCAFFSNLGYFGAFTAYAVFGETAYGLCILYLVFFIPSFYSLGFWIAARYGGTVKPSGTQTMSNDRLQFYPFAGMLAGILLNLAGIHHPLSSRHRLAAHPRLAAPMAPDLPGHERHQICVYAPDRVGVGTPVPPRRAPAHRGPAGSGDPDGRLPAGAPAALWGRPPARQRALALYHDPRRALVYDLPAAHPLSHPHGLH